MFNLLNLPTFIRITVVSIIIASVSYAFGYYQGKIAERNSITIKQKDITIAHLSMENNIIRNERDNSLAIVKNLTESNTQLIINNKKLKELVNEKTKQHINDTNIIRGNFLRYITASNFPTVPTNAESTSGTYEDATRYTATDVGDRINDGFLQCGIIRNQLIALINWLTLTTNDFNLYVGKINRGEVK